MGGEKSDVFRVRVAGEGSPPRGRGKGGEKVGGLCCVRITPAWAGKSGLRFYSAAVCQDHPRMGGEKRLRRQCARRSKGSPPRGRGKVHHRRGAGCSRGITPAWAGKSPHTSEGSVRCGDHPRVGGEKHKEESSVMELQGSPPRGRGKVVLHCGIIFNVGITPAWAGKSHGFRLGNVAGQDHPRVGGEKSLIYLFPFFRLGSPPRGRGKAMSVRMAGGLPRITPAWAGKSPAKTVILQRTKDHPRVGGEKPLLFSQHLVFLGSPPRGRGKGPSGAAP